MKKLLFAVFILILGTSTVFGHTFVPDFSTMKILRCDFDETVYNQDNTVLTKSKLFRIFYLDDENKLIYLQKEPIDHILYYETDKIEYNLQSMTDDYIMMAHTTIDRISLEYNSKSTMTYDNPMFGVRRSTSQGVCKFLD